MNNIDYEVLIEKGYTIASLANITAFINDQFHFHWQGFYIVEGEELTLGPFQGPIACNPILRGKGVCGACWEEQKTFNVPNVHDFEGHIACSPHTNSELVIPIFDSEKKVRAVLDLDSTEEDFFTTELQSYFEELCAALSILF
jgi:GAF domain-containing protein